MRKALIALAIGGLSLGMAEFTIMGILPDIAEDMQREIPVTAHLISLYALGVSIGAPILILATGRLQLKTVAILMMIAFFVFHGLFSIMPGFQGMTWTRFMGGLPHGTYFGVGSVIAAKLAPKGKEAQYISIMMTGLTLANLVGVPIGTYLGHHYSWRLTYAIIASFGLFTATALWAWLPAIDNKSAENIWKQLSYFKTREAWFLIVIVSIGTGGLFAWMSYIAPLVTEVSHLSANSIPIIMVLIGLGMVLGNLLGGKIADTFSPTKALIYCFSATSIMLIIVALLSPFGWTAYPLAFFTGLIVFTLGPSISILLIRTANGAETMAAAIGQASFNIGNTLGAFLGGIPISLGLTYDMPSLIGAGMALTGMFLTVLFYRTIILKKYR